MSATSIDAARLPSLSSGAGLLASLSRTAQHTLDTLSVASAAASASVSSLGSRGPASSVEEATHRARDLHRSADAASRRWLAREVDYGQVRNRSFGRASSTSSHLVICRDLQVSADAYKRTLREVQLNQAALKPCVCFVAQCAGASLDSPALSIRRLHDSVGNLAMRVGGARAVAARLVGGDAMTEAPAALASSPA